MMTKKDVLDLAVSCGLDKEKFFAQLKARGLDAAARLQKGELDSVSGGARKGTVLRSDSDPGDPGC